MNYLVDTNVFLEILLDQEKREICKRFLEKNSANLCISDFSLHSLGVILFKSNKEELFDKFANDVLPGIILLGLSIQFYSNLAKTGRSRGLDFDDAYQYEVAIEHELKIVTQDRDFEKVADRVELVFI